MNTKINSFNEWGRLKEVVVGVADEYNHHHLDTSFKLFYNDNTQAIMKRHFSFKESIMQSRDENREYFKIPEWIIEELIEDIEGMVKALSDFGVKVHRPMTLNNNDEIISPYWRTRPTPALNVRDQCVIIGDTIVETAGHVRGRYFENDYLKKIFYSYFKNGSNWIAMPKPVLTRDSIDPSYFTDQNIDTSHIFKGTEKPRFDIGYEIIFDGAQCIRLGKDILVNVANENHQLGFDWLQRMFGQKFNFHRIYRMADNHIDSILLPLKPGLMLLRSPEYLDFLPKKMRKWDIIYPPEAKELRFPDYGNEGFFLASKYIDLNVLSLDESTVMVNSLYPELIEVLEQRQFTVIPVQHRHRRLFGGGFHCFTLDCVRDGGIESYLD